MSEHCTVHTVSDFIRDTPCFLYPAWSCRAPRWARVTVWWGEDVGFVPGLVWQTSEERCRLLAYIPPGRAQYPAPRASHAPASCTRDPSEAAFLFLTAPNTLPFSSFSPVCFFRLVRVPLWVGPRSLWPRLRAWLHWLPCGESNPGHGGESAGS